ncbi:alpha/beta hydrolase [Aldersonia kunmingensis]|uniref:alpha/beta hydrolase n=1 Tax=Aldersonia kunmingensis TaxID=408066 RepID=UPI000A057C21|nr:alpha/beta fold hydrolase [Aldersonia kunmingensis]
MYSLRAARACLRSLRGLRSWVAVAVLLVAVATTAGCGAGPSDRPVVAVERIEPGSPVETGESTPPPPPAPDLQVPKTDLPWRDCTSESLATTGYGPGPAGLVLECAELSAPIDSSGSSLGTFTIGVSRARLPQTPADAPPLVLTSGSNRASTDTLAGLASGPFGSLLSSRPIVALDRRGIGTSTPIDCIPADVRTELQNNGQGAPDEPVAIAEASQSATVACKDFLQPHELAFDTDHAADDLEQLRLVWQVDTLGLLGTGNGTKVALSYAQRYPQHVGRMILDAPEAVGLDATTITEQQVQGAEAALTAFAKRCTGLNCSLGPDPYAAVTDLVRKADAGDLGPISANALVTAVTGFLGSPRGDQINRVPELADALSAAGRGDYAALSALIEREQGATANDGEFVSRCTDGQQWPPVEKVRTLAEEWRKKYPVFGEQAALAMLSCSAWPTADAPPLPASLDIPVLVTRAIADPVVGAGGVSSVTGAVTNAGGEPSVIEWRGYGHPVSAHSGCVQQAIVDYAATANLPSNGTACPA